MIWCIVYKSLKWWSCCTNIWESIFTIHRKSTTDGYVIHNKKREVDVYENGEYQSTLDKQAVFETSREFRKNKDTICHMRIRWIKKRMIILWCIKVYVNTFTNIIKTMKSCSPSGQIDFQKVDLRTEGKWLIHGIKHHKDN